MNCWNTLLKQPDDPSGYFFKCNLSYVTTKASVSEKGLRMSSYKRSVPFCTFLCICTLCSSPGVTEVFQSSEISLFTNSPHLIFYLRTCYVEAAFLELRVYIVRISTKRNILIILHFLYRHGCLTGWLLEGPLAGNEFDIHKPLWLFPLLLTDETSR